MPPRRSGVDVLTLPEDLDHRRILSGVGQTTQFDLVIVSDDQDVALAGNEETADFGSSGQLLEVGLG